MDSPSGTDRTTGIHAQNVGDYGVKTLRSWDYQNLRVDLVTPAVGDGTWGNGFPYAGYQYAWLSWGLAAHLGEHAAFGFSYDHSYSTNTYVDSLNALTAALLYEHAAWSGDEADQTVAALWTLRHVGGADIAEDAYRYADALAV